MKGRKIAAGIAIAAGLFAPAGSHADEATQTAIYVGVVGDLTLQCVTPANIGGACFTLGENTTHVTINVEDAFNTLAGFRIDWRDEFGARIAPLTHTCGTVSMAVPAGAVEARVAVDGPLAGPSACGETMANGTGLIGEITVDEYTVAS